MNIEFQMGFDSETEFLEDSVYFRDYDNAVYLLRRMQRWFPNEVYAIVTRGIREIYYPNDKVEVSDEK